MFSEEMHSNIEKNIVKIKMKNSELFSATPLFFPPTVSRTGLWDILDSKGFTSTLPSKTNFDKSTVTHWSQLFLDAFLLPNTASDGIIF